jgi:hypothetical protein
VIESVFYSNGTVLMADRSIRLEVLLLGLRELVLVLEAEHLLHTHYTVVALHVQ